MNGLVVYQSKTGFTQKYAEWIAQALSCEAKALSKVTPAQIAACDFVVYGGWVMGGMISGLEKMKGFQPKKLTVFAVGFTEKKDVDEAKCAELNKLSVPFFYYEGGMNPKKMGFFGRTIVKLVTKKPLEFTDRTDKNEITALVESVQKEL